MLRTHTNELALRVTAETMENDERQERLQDNANRVKLARERLNQMRMCLLMQSERLVEAEGTGNENNKMHDGIIHYQEGVGGGLTDALHSNAHEIQTLRFHMACKVFDMHRLDVGEKYTSNPTATNNYTRHKQPEHEKTASGVGKISGLPLPHAGPILYGVIPPEVLSSSLRLVASLTHLVSCCLGVVLPHPILVYSTECSMCGYMYDGYGGNIIDASAGDDETEDEDVGDYYDENHTNERGGRRHDQDGKFNLCSACRSDENKNEVLTMTQNAHLDKSMPLASSVSSSTSTAHTRSKSSLLSLVGSSAWRAITLTTTVTSRVISHVQPSSTIALDLQSDHFHQHPTSSHKMSHPRLQFNQRGVSNENSVANIISRRINYASYAYLRENHDNSATEYVLVPPRWGGGEAGSSSSKTSCGDTNQSLGGHDDVVANGTVIKQTEAQQTMTYATREEFHVAEERFATGLQLLQNDIVALCFRAGVDVSTLWPAESVLLNLHALWCHCRVMRREGASKK